MRSLRSRLILSHILPLVIILPIFGLVLVYIIETQVLLKNISTEIEEQADLTALLASTQPDIWTDQAEAQVFVSRFSASNESEINLLDRQGILLASNDPEDDSQIGIQLDEPNLPIALGGQPVIEVTYSFNLEAEVVEVLVPVTGTNREILGIVRLSNELGNVYDRFLSLRYLIAAVVTVALVLAVLLGFLIASNLERSLRHVTDAIYDIASGQSWTTLPEEGPVEIRRLIFSFNTLINRLRGFEDSRRQLLANLVHEVSRPIGAVQAAIQALLRGAEEQPALRRELLEGMEAQVNRLHPLLDNLAKLYETVLGTLELQRQPVNLNKWLLPTANSWREAAHAKGLFWEIDIVNPLPTVSADPDRLAQVLGNLLSNAIKYTPAGGQVSVKAGSSDNDVWIKISDTGPGIALDEQNQIFEPFFRSSRQQRFPQGMGLGLTIASDLVKAHGGHLDLESVAGQGSHFTIHLPR